MNLKNLTECLDNYIRKNNKFNVNEDWRDDVSISDLQVYQKGKIPYSQKTHSSTNMETSKIYRNDYHLTQDEVERTQKYKQAVEKKQKMNGSNTQKKKKYQIPGTTLKGEQRKREASDVAPFTLSDEDADELIRIWADMECHNPYASFHFNDIVKFKEQCVSEGIHDNIEEWYKKYKSYVNEIREKEHLPKKTKPKTDWVEMERIAQGEY